MKLTLFAWNITSPHANGGAVFFRGLCAALARAGLEVCFVQEAASPESCANEPPPGVYILNYRSGNDLQTILDACADSQAVLKFSGCGTFDRFIEESILARYAGPARVIFVDGDAPDNLPPLLTSPEHFRRATVPKFDAVLVCGGGKRACDEYAKLGAVRTGILLPAVSPEVFRPIPPSEGLWCDLLFLGNRDPKKDSAVEELFIGTAILRRDKRFILAGAGWEDWKLPTNIRYVGHLSPETLPAAYSSARFVLNITRPTMRRYGYCPSSRLFEAASSGSCIITDPWPGLDSFFNLGEELLVARSADDIARYMDAVDSRLARKIGDSARRQVLARHTCDIRAEGLIRFMGDLG